MMSELEPRHKWLQKRIDECLDEIHKSRKEEDFYRYQENLKDLIEELQYVSNEWMKYYPG
jgi:hypothetical protein